MQILNADCQFQYDMLGNTQLSDIMRKLESLSKEGSQERFFVLTERNETLLVRLKNINGSIYCISGWPTKDGKRLTKIMFPFTNFVFILTGKQ